MDAFMKALDIGSRLLPSLIQTVARLIKNGADPAEVEENITSRIAEYEAAKVADLKALKKKHGLPTDEDEEP